MFSESSTIAKRVSLKTTHLLSLDFVLRIPFTKLYRAAREIFDQVFRRSAINLIGPIKESAILSEPLRHNRSHLAYCDGNMRVQRAGWKARDSSPTQATATHTDREISSHQNPTLILDYSVDLMIASHQGNSSRIHGPASAVCI